MGNWPFITVSKGAFMTDPRQNRFQDFFDNEKYVTLKRFLYNYILRKHAVEKAMRDEEKELVLEIGSGISPVFTSWDRIVYSDLSPSAMNMLKEMLGKGQCVVADAANLPFDDHSFSHVIASEVLEHLADDKGALREISRVLKPDGALVITFPHRRFYFSYDDRFVKHYRRYEISDMVTRLKESGFETVSVGKVLGPLEKITTLAVTACASIAEKLKRRRDSSADYREPADAFITLFKWGNRVYAALVWLDALIMPRALSTDLLIKARKIPNEIHERPGAD